MNKYYLTPIYDSRETFNSKAVVLVDYYDAPELIVLESYGTAVAQLKVIYGVRHLTLLPGWDSSQTTLRHVKEFLKQHGYKAETLKQIREDYA